MKNLTFQCKSSTPCLLPTTLSMISLWYRIMFTAEGSRCFIHIFLSNNWSNRFITLCVSSKKSIYLDFDVEEVTEIVSALFGVEGGLQKRATRHTIVLNQASRSECGLKIDFFKIHWATKGSNIHDCVVWSTTDDIWVNTDLIWR